MKKSVLICSVLFVCIMSACSSNQAVENEATIIRETVIDETITDTKIEESNIVDESKSESTSDFNIVKFGKYEQDGDESNGAEDIEWIVLDSNNDGELFLISRYILDIQPFNKELCAITWENSSIRKWLNDNFYNVAFTDEEKEKIKLSCVRNDTRVINDLNNISTINDLNENYEKDTFDKLYLLSNKEISQYHDYICKKIPYGTEYAKNVARNSRFQNAYWLSPDEFYEPDYDDDGNPILDDMLNERTYFWLRTPGFYQHMVLTCGYTDDDIYDSGSVACDFESGVRSAMWVKYK